MMRFGLFWRILGAFLLTQVVMGVAIALLYAPTHFNDRPSLGFAPSMLVLLERRLEAEGVGAAREELGMLAPVVRSRIAITRMTDAAGRETSLVRHATAPDGSRYAIAYGRQQRGWLDGVPTLSIWGSVIAGLLFSIGWALYLSRPMRMLRDGFRRLAAGQLDVALDPAMGRRSDEFSDLAADFTRMTERLRQLVGARDRLLHDVSHELRSPLTRLQLAIGLAKQDPAQRDASLDRIEREAGKLDRLVGELLTLARAESGAEAAAEFFDPVEVVGQVVQDAQIEAEAAEVQVELVTPPIEDDMRPPVAGSATLFQRAVENVLRNAIRFSPRGTVIGVIAEVLEAPPRYRVVVADRGPGVPPELLGSLLDPFVHADPQGTGLGLAIAERAARALGGTLTCRNGEAGGFVAELAVPAAIA